MLSNDMLFKTSGFAVLWRQKFHNEILAILKIYKATSRTREVKLIDFANHNTNVEYITQTKPKRYMGRRISHD